MSEGRKGKVDSMEMEMETNSELVAVVPGEPKDRGVAPFLMDIAEIAGTSLSQTMERLASAAGALEQVVEQLFERQGELALNAEASVGRIVATVESRREAELEQKLAAAETEIAELKAAGVSAPVSVTHGRKTLPVAMVNLLAKQGVTVDSVEAGALDAALASLSIEQRIAVKSQLMRVGLLG